MSKVLNMTGGGTDTSADTVVAGALRSGYTAHDANGDKITGTILSQAAATITPGTSAKTAVAAGRYTTGAVTVAGDANLVAGNIKSGTSIFGVTGTLNGGPTVISGTYTKESDWSTLNHRTTTPLGGEFYAGRATNCDNLAVFSGTTSWSSDESRIYSCDSSLTYVRASQGLRERRNNGTEAAANTGNYALFGSGLSDGNSHDLDSVDAYDSSLTRTAAPSLSEAKERVCGASIGNYALFAGGQTYSGDRLDTVDAYDASLTRIAGVSLSQQDLSVAAANTGNYVLIAGGFSYNFVNAYDTSLTRSLPTQLSAQRCYVAGAQIGNYALFAGGQSPYNKSLSTVDAYDTSLTHTEAPPLSQAKHTMGSAWISDVIAVFAGGDTGWYNAVTTVESYDTSLVRALQSNLSRTARDATVGLNLIDRMVFLCYSKGEIYEANTTIHLTLTDASAFSDSGTINGGVTLS